MTTQTSACLNTKNEQNVVRSLQNFEPSTWGFSFASFSLSELDFELCTKAVEELREPVKHMLIQSASDSIENIKFIDALSRLGLAYHFEYEIEEQLSHIFSTLPNVLNDSECDLYEVALVFIVFRQYGYKMSSDAFKKFKTNDGEFIKPIISDVKGILFLYEATFFRVHGEEILDEALAFTRPILETFADESSTTNLSKKVKNALSLPFHQGIEIVEIRKYISFYEEDESSNETLLKFAKLNFNRLQLLYKQALLTRWWQELRIIENNSFGRNRIAEGYFWVVGAHFEREFALARQLMLKYGLLLLILDDTYDHADATFEDIQHLTVAFERWSIDSIDQLPESMKIIFSAVLNLSKETEKYDDEKDGYCCGIRANFHRSHLNE